MMIRSSPASLRFANSGKQVALRLFLQEFRQAVRLAVDYLWKLETSEWNLSQDLLNLPKYLDYKQLSYSGPLSARALQCALEQARAIVRGQTKKRSQLLWVLSKKDRGTKIYHYLEGQLSRYPLRQPQLSDSFPILLSAKCIDFASNAKAFDAFLRLKCTGFPDLKLPLNYNPQFKKRASWKRCSSVYLSETEVVLIQETLTPSLKKEGKIVGADTGIKSVVMLSDGQTSKADQHGHTLETITQKLERRQKGSKGFKRAQQHRRNYINWSVNQLNLSEVKEIRLEKINTFTGQRNRFLSHFSHQLISDKLMRLAEELGVHVSLQSCAYKSQRCSGCGIVRAANRRGKIYSCYSCGLGIDADLNSAINNSLDLPDVPFAVRQQELAKRSGFLWKPEGLFNLAGQELIVPDARV